MDSKEQKVQADNLFVSLRELSAEEAEKLHPMVYKMWVKANSKEKR